MTKASIRLTFLLPILLLWNSSFAQNHHKRSLKIMTYNIKHGEAPGLSHASHHINLDTLAAVIKAENPDIVALQEVDSMWSRSDSQFQPEVLAKKTGMKYYYYGNTRTFKHWGYGNAILSKYKLKDAHTLHYPYIYHKGAENRVAAVATIVLPDGKEFIFASTHLDYQHKDTRRLEARTLNTLAAYSSVPVILTGDLNSSLESPLIATLKEQYIQSCQSCRPSFPSDKPKVKLDYIMYSKSSPFQVVRSHVVHDSQTTFASDHCPYAAELIWKKQ